MKVGTSLFEQARHAAGLSQGELARRAGTSRPTLSAYENGRKSPSLTTAERVLAQAGFALVAERKVEFRVVQGRRRSIVVPSVLPRLPLVQAFARVALPLSLNWSEPRRVFRLVDRADRARVYEIVLREGTADHIVTYIDGALLVDLWPELVVPREVRAAWAPLVEQFLPGGG